MELTEPHHSGPAQFPDTPGVVQLALAWVAGFPPGACEGDSTPVGVTSVRSRGGAIWFNEPWATLVDRLTRLDHFNTSLVQQSSQEPPPVERTG